MGLVARVREPNLGRDLALKVLRPALQTKAIMIRRFLIEARICGQLQHPGIVPVL
jgi:serine/threonine-protein kinase